MDAPERTLRLVVDLSYDQKLWHGNDEDAKRWFESVLLGDCLALLDCGDAGDVIGSVKVVRADIPAARIAEQEAENARLRALLDAHDAWARGEPSRPPRAALGKDRAP